MKNDKKQQENTGDARLEEERSPDEVVRLFLQAERLNKTAERSGRRWSQLPGIGSRAPDSGLAAGRPARGAVEAIRQWRPTPRQVSVALVVAIALAMPLLVPSMLLLALVILVISYLSLGHDRSTEMAAAGYSSWSRRDPKAAETARARAARVSARLSAWAEHLPESWTRGLYLPDFERPEAEPEGMQTDPFERLKQDS